MIKRLGNDKINRDSYFQIGYEPLIFSNLSESLNNFYDSIKNTKEGMYEDYDPKITFAKEGIPFRVYIPAKGKYYLIDAEYEQKFASSIYFVKNTDENCLYAALFCAFAYKFNKFQINGETFQFDKNFKERAMQDYKQISKTKNLRFFALLLKELLNPNSESLTD